MKRTHACDNLGIAYEYLEDLENARKAYQKAFELEPNAIKKVITSGVPKQAKRRFSKEIKEIKKFEKLIRLRDFHTLFILFVLCIKMIPVRKTTQKIIIKSNP